MTGTAAGGRVGGQRRDTAVLAVTGLLSAFVLVWFTVNLAVPFGPAWLGWLPGPLSIGLDLVPFAALACAPEVSPAGRRFWRHITFAVAAVAAGAAVQSVAVLTHLVPVSRPQDLPVPSAALFTIAVVVIAYALLRLPSGVSSRAQRLHLVFDGATVMAGASLFIWYIVLVPLLASRHGLAEAVGSLVAAVFAQLALAAIVKVMLTGCEPVGPAALRILSLSTLTGLLATALQPLIEHHPNLSATQLICAPVGFINAWAAHAVRKDLAAGARRRERRPYSLLPYLAVVATDALLVHATITRPDDRTPVVVAGAIVVTALVAVRQLAAFVDNGRLLRSLRRHEDQLHHQASHDALTQLANRTLFGERVRAALAGPPAGGAALLLVDLDDFKMVNDTLGHTAGDGLLIAVAERLRGCVRGQDTVARLGGDEFAVLLAESTPAVATAVTQRILCALGEPFLTGGHSLLVQASIGVAEAVPGDDPERLLRNADIAMYAAKERGKGQFARYTVQMHRRIQEQAEVGADLHGALERGEFRLLYQPIVDLPTGAYHAVEALVRWQHPARGLLLPGQFIPAAERMGLIVPLGRWVLATACRQAADWARTTPGQSVAVSVNIAARQLQEPDFAAEVAAVLAATGLPAGRLTVEVTETAVLKGGPVLRNLSALHATGVRIALDDFGTGQSSLGLLRTCPVDILKLDRSFVEEVADAGRPAVATAVAQIARALDLDTVAEGIESVDQAEILYGLGYRRAQGYLYGRPLTAAQTAQRLAGDAVAAR